jgi:O-antigen/teichoic acid export membrane protein
VKTTNGSTQASPRAAGRLVGRLRGSAGVRASAILLFGTAASLAGAYAYNLLCIRWLRARDYGDVAALTTVATILHLPVLGVQAALAREVAAFRADADGQAIHALYRLAVRRAALLTAGVAAFLILLSPVLAGVLNIEATVSVVAAAFLAAVGALLPVFQGFLQGLLRFARVGVGLAVYGLGRPLLAIPLLLLGLGVAGALTAATFAAVVAVTISVAGLRDIWSRPARTKDVHIELADFTPVIFGLFAFTTLMNADVLAANVFLGADEAGEYASAALVGKLAALLPMGVIAPVLLPQATARLQRGDDALRILSASLLVTAVFGIVLTGALFAVPQSFVEWAFGEQFAAARDLLGPCAAVMTLCGLINVHLTFAFALRDRQLTALLGIGVLVQAVLFAVLNDTPYQILTATALAALVVIVPHELRSPFAAWRVVRAS